MSDPKTKCEERPLPLTPEELAQIELDRAEAEAESWEAMIEAWPSDEPELEEGHG